MPNASTKVSLGTFKEFRCTSQRGGMSDMKANALQKILIMDHEAPGVWHGEIAAHALPWRWKRYIANWGGVDLAIIVDLFKVYISVHTLDVLSYRNDWNFFQEDCWYWWITEALCPARMSSIRDSRRMRCIAKTRNSIHPNSMISPTPSPDLSSELALQGGGNWSTTREVFGPKAGVLFSGLQEFSSRRTTFSIITVSGGVNR